VKRKAIALFTAFVMALAMMPLMAVPAFAATTNSAISAPNMKIGTAGQTPGDIVIQEATGTIGELSAGTIITLTLPTGVTNAATVGVTPVADVGSGYALAADVNAVCTTGQNTITITVGTAAVAFPGIIVIPGATFKYDLAAATPAGDINVAVSSNNGKASTTPVKNGVAVTATTTNSCTTAPIPKIVAGINAQAAGNLKIVENVAGVLANTKTIAVTCPSGVAFNAPPVATPTAGGTSINLNAAGAGVAVAGVLSNANRTATWTVTAASTAAATINIPANLDVTTGTANGNVDYTIGGTATNLTKGAVTVAEIVTPGTTNACTTSPVPSVTIGVLNQAAGNLRLTENVTGALLAGGRTIILTLPVGVTFNAAPVATPTDAAINIGGGPGVAQAGTLSNANRVATWTVTAQAAAATQLNIPSALDIAATVPVGAVDVAISGSAGATAGAVTIANARGAAALTAASTPTLALGTQNQSIGDLTVTEGFTGAYAAAANIDLVLPSGVEWAALPTVTVSGSNLSLANPVFATIGYVNDTIRITVNAGGASTDNPATITVTGCKVNVLSSAATGDVTVKLGAPATPTDTALAALIVSGTTQASFVLDKTTYTIGGMTYNMDVSPYIENNRTYVPVRYLAYALGVSGNDITWDSATKTVTLTKGTDVVTLVMGSTTLDKNGVTTTMDVAPSITDGRTMLPARWVAEAFGATVEWNGATQTVLITYL